MYASVRRVACALGITLLFTQISNAQSTSKDSNKLLVPQQLLGLVHAPEVHAELNLSPEAVKRLENLFEKIDGDWFRARILPEETRYSRIQKLETIVRQWFNNNTGQQQVQRVRQLELRAQGMRMLLRPDLQHELGITAEQSAKLVSLAKAVNEATSKLRDAQMRNKITEELKTNVVTANKNEQAALKTVLKPEQFQKLGGLLGEPFDTSSLKRIYPMAPELIPAQNWINSNPLTLKKLRGKVVLLHFYAFQCYNCHANFGHYKKWHDKYGDDVVVLGIQTPETERERDPDEVRDAAKERELNFPILVDLESKNWKAWSNTMWPTVYVIDKNGYIRHWWQGELNWNGATGDQTIEQIVGNLLQEKVGT